MKVLGKITTAAAACLLSFVIFISGAVRADAYKAIKARIAVDCLEISENGSYSYIIKISPLSKNDPVPSSQIVDISENSRDYFEIYITEPGTYRYEISETAGNDSKIQYDKEVYEVTVFVTNTADDELTYSVTTKLKGAKTKPQKIEFQNKIIGASQTVTTPQVTTETAQTTTNVNPLTGYVNRTSAYVLGLLMIAAVIIAVCVFLFKDKKSEEENENEK